MLYKSLQQTISEYEKRKKETQSEGDRKVFKWKVLALSFAILLIVLIGIMSQLIENHSEDEGEIRNLTFLPSMLKSSDELAQITSIKGMVYGLSQTQRIVFDKAEPLLISSHFNIIDLLQIITNKRNIVFLFTLQQPTTPQTMYRFGMLLKSQYDNIDPDGNNDVEIYDSIDDLTSVFFSLNQNNALQMSLHSKCALYNFKRITGDLSIMETMIFRKPAEGEQENKVEFSLLNWKCFGTEERAALEQIKKLTGIELDNVKEMKNLEVKSVEVFYLSFNGGNI